MSAKAKRSSITKSQQPPVSQETTPKHRFRLILEVVFFIIAAIALAWWAQYIEPSRLIARDSLYHLGHAGIYATRGLAYTEFPWTTYSIIRVHAADIWYGFHLLLVPFASLHYSPEHQVNQVKWAGVFLTASLLFLVYLAMCRGRVVYPWTWPFLMVIPCIFRFTQVRPQLLSTALTGLLFVFLISGGVWSIFLLSTLIAFLHLAFFWLILLTTLVVVIVKRITEKTFEWKKIAAACAGIIAGWLLRPNPIGAAKILYVQIFQLVLQRQHNASLSFGLELHPVNQAYLMLSQGVFLVVWFIFALLILALASSRKADISTYWWTWLWGSFILSILFFIMMISQYMRSLDHWTLFATIMMSGTVTCLVTMQGSIRVALVKLPAHKRSYIRSGIFLSVCVLFAFMVWQSLYSAVGYTEVMAKQMRPYRYRAASEWMSKNTPEGSIVFHANWGVFPELFFWNKHNHYIGGMDPMFQYTFSKDLYWKADHILNGDGAPLTWGTQNRQKDHAVDMFTAVYRDFHASYYFVEKTDPGTAPRVAQYIQADPRFVWKYEDNEAVVFQLVDKSDASDK